MALVEDPPCQLSPDPIDHAIEAYIRQAAGDACGLRLSLRCLHACTPTNTAECCQGQPLSDVVLKADPFSSVASAAKEGPSAADQPCSIVGCLYCDPPRSFPPLPDGAVYTLSFANPPVLITSDEQSASYPDFPHTAACPFAHASTSAQPTVSHEPSTPAPSRTATAAKGKRRRRWWWLPRFWKSKRRGGSCVKQTSHPSPRCLMPPPPCTPVSLPYRVPPPPHSLLPKLASDDDSDKEGAGGHDDKHAAPSTEGSDTSSECDDGDVLTSVTTSPGQTCVLSPPCVPSVAGGADGGEVWLPGLTDEELLMGRRLEALVGQGERGRGIHPSIHPLNVMCLCVCVCA